LLNSFQSILIVAFVVILSLAFLSFVHRAWPSELRRQQNDLIGWQVSVLGTTYAVIVGFMLYAVWTNFEAADVNAEAEANSLVNVVRMARALPAAQRQEIQNTASEYVTVILTQEWPAMSRFRFSPASSSAIKRLWAIVNAAQVHTPSEQISLDHTISELSNMTEHRRVRQLQVASDLPPILWAVLIVGAIATIASACLFGSTYFILHLIQVFMLSLLISLALVAIADINRPFQGSVHISPTGFQRARVTLDDLLSTK
jgi:Protein of unknown function (DUF4239)